MLMNVDVDVDVENGVAADVDAVSSWVKVGRHSHHGIRNIMTVSMMLFMMFSLLLMLILLESNMLTMEPYS